MRLPFILQAGDILVCRRHIDKNERKEPGKDGMIYVYTQNFA